MEVTRLLCGSYKSGSYKFFCVGVTRVESKGLHYGAFIMKTKGHIYYAFIEKTKGLVC